MHDNVAEYPIPIILIGNQTDLRNDPKTLNDLSKQEKQPITINGVLEYSTHTRVQLKYHFLSTRSRTRNLRYSVGTRTRRLMYSVQKSAEYTSTFGVR